MIEIVFSDSACGSLKAAQHFGEGEYSGSAFAVLASDGSQPTMEEFRQAQQEFQASERAAWENAVPMGGHIADIYGFSFYLSIGDISEHQLLQKRHEVLRRLFSIFPSDMNGTESAANVLIQQVHNTLQEVLSRSVGGESIRIWYSSQPDEACGLCWFLAQLENLKQPHGKVFLIKLPEIEQKQQEIVQHVSWGEIAPEEWIHYVPLQQQASPVFCQACAEKWHCLQQENTPLRAVLNGQLVSMPETLYDSVILREITAQGEIFHEAAVIGTILGRYQLGISDAWIAMRIQQMISDGILEPVSQPKKDDPLYHRKLRKIK